MVKILLDFQRCHHCRDKPKTKSAERFKPREKPKVMKRSVSDGILPNKLSEKYYNDLIGNSPEDDRSENVSLFWFLIGVERAPSCAYTSSK